VERSLATVGAWGAQSGFAHWTSDVGAALRSTPRTSGWPQVIGSTCGRLGKVATGRLRSLATRTLRVGSDPSQDRLDRGEAWIFRLAHYGEQLEPAFVIRPLHEVANSARGATAIAAAAARRSIRVATIGSSVVSTAAATPGRSRLAIRSPSMVHLAARLETRRPQRFQPKG
jgi:hypothetical protein